jgi:hypothetical protein
MALRPFEPQKRLRLPVFPVFGSRPEGTYTCMLGARSAVDEGTMVVREREGTSAATYLFCSREQNAQPRRRRRRHWPSAPLPADRGEQVGELGHCGRLVEAVSAGTRMLPPLDSTGSRIFGGRIGRCLYDSREECVRGPFCWPGG